VIESRKTEWARHAARMGKKRGGQEYKNLFVKYDEVNGK
jgi:hypothetical protein